MANKYTKTAVDGNDMYYYFSGALNGPGRYNVGYNTTVGATIKGALRFQNVQIAQGATGIEAGLNLYAQEQFGSSDIYVKVWGIDEDNTANFSSGDPFGRTKTSASNTHNLSLNDGEYFGIGVGAIIEEIVGRGGWSQGNSIGFLIEDNGSSTSESTYLYDQFSSNIDSYLSYRVGSEPDFNPTDKSVAAPTLPTMNDDFGLKISYPGYSVLTATQEQLYYHSYKRKHKIYSEGVITTTANVVSNIAHGLAYIPFCLAYAKETGSTKRYKIPRYQPVALFQDQFPSLDATNGTVEVDSTNLKITTTSNCSVYYRIFYDQIS